MTGQSGYCQMCGPCRTYRDPSDPPDAHYCARCGLPAELEPARDGKAADR
jgi:hypothetical protein